MRTLAFFLIGISLLLRVEALPLKERLIEIQRAIDEVIAKEEPKALVGIEVLSLEDETILYQKNEQCRLIPASGIKVFVAAAALDMLGKDFCFKTLITGELKDSTLKECSLIASGDPSLNSLDLQALVSQLKHADVLKIEGDLVVDLSIFDSISMGPGWMWDEEPAFWCSPMGALNLDHNCAKVIVSPALNAGSPCLVSLGIESKHIQLESSAETVKKVSTLNAFCKESKEDQSIFKVEGTLALNSVPKSFRLPVKAPERYAAEIFKSLLKESGIQFNGELKYLLTQGKKKPVIAIHSSVPLKELIQTMFKESDNLFADSLFKKLGSLKYGLPGTWEKGRFAVRDFLIKRVGLDWEEMEVVDGSGLSRYNLLSPYQMAYFLYWISQTPYAIDFQTALSVGGLDGTLKRRMQSPVLKGNVRAKTGTMQGVSTLSGYLITEENETIAFAIFINNYVKKAKEIRLKIEDVILEILAKESL